MYIVIVGGGDVGLSLTRLLQEHGHEVVLVEKDPTRYAKLSEELGEAIIMGDGAELGTLLDLGANRADVLVAVTETDQDNLVICQLAKLIYLIPRTIAIVKDPRNEELFSSLGVDATVSSTGIIASLIEEKIDAGMAIPLLAFKECGLEIFKTQLSTESSIIKKKISQLDLPKDLIIIAALRGSQVIIPKGDTVFLPGDTIIMLIREENKEAFKRLFLEAV
ncbi:MAG: TrkA family potassium uptake protein [Candidatus Zixiibacteriota bacterium]|nr:MAG: TrkA family potassium uptake protein [candidate division Zixibacteria bacterium]